KHSQIATAFTQSANGMLAAAGVDGNLQLWDPRTDQEMRSFTGHGARRVLCLAFSSDSHLLASGGGYDRNGELNVWDVETGKKLYGFTDSAISKVISMAFSSDNKVLISRHSAPGTGEYIKFWDVHTGKKLRAFTDKINKLDQEHSL